METTRRSGSAASPVVTGDSLIKGSDRAAAPRDVVAKSSRKSRTPELVKQRSHFFEDAFSVKDGHPVKERLQMEAIVLAEVKTNVIISDEFTFITELSYSLSTRYQRPVSSIAVTLQHGACMLFGGTFEPAYVMQVTALSSQLLPVTNKRNAALLQRHMEEAIGVSPARGFLQFVPTREENMAVNGRTLAAEMDDVERNASGVDEVANLGSRGSRAKAKLSVRSIGSFRPSSVVAGPAPELTPPASASDGVPPPAGAPTLLPTIPGTPERAPAAAGQQDGIVTARRKKSFIASIFGRRHDARS